LADSPLFDVEHYRGLPTRHAEWRQVVRSTLVLGSTQPAAVVAKDQLTYWDVEAIRRRGGGGAVLLKQGDHLWLDAWVPRADPLWTADVSEAAVRIGAWWRAGIESFGVGGLELHEGRARPGELGELVCFAGRGPGEVFHLGRKVVGLSQWRSREGTLFSTCAYAHWEPRPLVNLINVGGKARDGLVAELVERAVGLDDIEPTGIPDFYKLRDVLLSSFPAWAGHEGSSPGPLAT
jgi:lipoate---protein ligase